MGSEAICAKTKWVCAWEVVTSRGFWKENFDRQGNKRCSKCLDFKPLDQYIQRGRWENKNRRDSWCRSCCVDRTRQWRRTITGDTKLKFKFSNLIKTAKRRSKEMTLTFDEYKVVAVHPCYYCLNALCGQSQQGGGLDRLDNNIGYVPGNVVSCCAVCNKTRGDRFTVEETKAMIATVLEMRKRLSVAV